MSDSLLIGGLVQVDWSDEEDDTNNSAASGTGWMVSPYIAGRIPDTMISYDARVAWGQSDNDVTPIGTYTDEFETERFLISGKVRGGFSVDQMTVEPSLSLSWFQETQEAYTNTLGASIPEQTISLGELTFGPAFSMTTTFENGLQLSPRAEISGVWNFDIDEGASSQGYVLAEDDIRARLNLGVTIIDDNGARLILSGYYDGLGVDDYESLGGKVYISVPIQ